MAIKFHISVYNDCCELSEFTINRIVADKDHFVHCQDLNPPSVDLNLPYFCGDMVANRVQPTERILQYYGITLEEFNMIASILEEKLSFGRCSKCGRM